MRKRNPEEFSDKFWNKNTTAVWQCGKFLISFNFTDRHLVYGAIFRTDLAAVTSCVSIHRLLRKIRNSFILLCLPTRKVWSFLKHQVKIFWNFLTRYVPFSAGSKLYPRAAQPSIHSVRRAPFQTLKQPKREAGLQLAPMYLLTYNFNHPWVLMVLG
jgi:hypothetical protein